MLDVKSEVALFRTTIMRLNADGFSYMGFLKNRVYVKKLVTGVTENYHSHKITSNDSTAGEGQFI